MRESFYSNRLPTIITTYLPIKQKNFNFVDKLTYNNFFVVVVVASWAFTLKLWFANLKSKIGVISFSSRKEN